MRERQYMWEKYHYFKRFITTVAMSGTNTNEEEKL